MELSKIYEKTNRGLDIILDLVPQAGESVSSPKKAFKIRDERTASAYLYPPKHGGDHWCIVDYGASEGGRAMSPIDLYMREKGYSKSDFYRAVEELGQKYGVVDNIDKKVNRPVEEWYDKNDYTFDAKHPFERRISLLPADIKVFGRTAKEEHLIELGWFSVEKIVKEFKEKVKVTYSNPDFPILVQENHYLDEIGTPNIFYKVYKPLAFDKRDRFYIIGNKPKDYIYGLDAARKKIAGNPDDENDNKLQKIAIVSGGSDAVICLSMGLQPVYLNSEEGSLSDDAYKTLKGIAKNIISIPDIDPAGIKAGKRLALERIDIATVWLPNDVMAQLKDNRGRQKKDLKDWIQLYPSREAFNTLIKNAMTAKFWRSVKDNENKFHWETSLVQLEYFLALNGYYTLRDPNTKDYRIVHVEGIKVEEVKRKDVILFLKEWMEKRGLSVDLMDTVLRSADINKRLELHMHEADLDFRNSTSASQTFYFSNAIVTVTKDGMKKMRYDEAESTQRYVWAKDIIPHSYTEQPVMFDIQANNDGSYSIKVLNTSSELFCFLINTSRLHWRKEMETRFGDDFEAKEEYAKANKFRIDGEGLSESEIADQMMCLVNKIFAYGYLLHHYKKDSVAWAVICYDNHIGENDECNGRTGKSLFAKALKPFVSSVYIEAKNPKIIEHRNLFAGVTEQTGMIAIDECHKHLDYQFFFGRITGDFALEKKYENPYSIPFELSPKLLLMTNFVMKNIDPSTEARLLPSVFSDYYHYKSEKNDFLETRKVSDDFGHDLWDSQYNHWDEDINFLLQCEQFYLSVIENGQKILPPLDTIKKREQKARMGKSFNDWADDALQEGSNWLDKDIKLDDLYNDYKQVTKDNFTSPLIFVKKLKEYIGFSDHLSVFNPMDVTGKNKDGEQWRTHKTNGYETHIYIRSVSGEEALKPKEPVQKLLDFDDESSQGDYPF